MSHYGYADARPMLEEFGYQIVLYTAQNIDDLAADLGDLSLDAIIFASNALNDQTIRETVLSQDFRKAFDDFVKSARGCLILHQLRMAEDVMPLGFLPDTSCKAIPKTRPGEEKATDGDLHTSSIAKNHAFFLYPNSIQVTDVKKQCHTFRSLNGLYWHYWSEVSSSDWDVLLYDTGSNGAQRPIVLTTKEFEPYRIVLCSLALDWQKQKQLLNNILVYVVEGKHNTAVIKDSKVVSAGFEYLLVCLRSQKFPFRIYNADQELKELERNLKNGIHTNVIVGPSVDLESLDPTLSSYVKSAVNGGAMRLVRIAEDRGLKEFHVAGRERYALRLLYNLELQIQQVLREGYIDGSFWSTIESLQILNDLKSHAKSKYDKAQVEKVLEIAATHDRRGSYDEVFGVTCALLWLRVNYLGFNHKDVQSTLKWIRVNLSGYEDREKALAYQTMVNVKVATPKERESLRELLLAQEVRFDRLSEIDLIVYLRAAVAADVFDIITPIVTRLEASQKNGCWIDLATTATAVTALLEALSLLRSKNHGGYTRILSPVESMIFNSIIYIQNSMAKTSTTEGAKYPWDNKASTSLKCIYAWLKFEELVDLPVQELIDALSSYSGVDSAKSSAKTALTILEEFRRSNEVLGKEVNVLTRQAQETSQAKKMNRHLLLLSAFILYSVASVAVYLISIGKDAALAGVLIGAFVKGWLFHFSFLTLLITAFGVIPLWRSRSSRVEKHE